MTDPRIDQSALDAATEALALAWMDSGSPRADAERVITTYLAAADKAATAEGLVSTRAGLALANAAYTEGAHDMLNACNSTDNVFVKPVSPYSAPLLRMIKEYPR